MASANAKLILVDGFAGSGKSTAAQRLWLNLVRGGRDATWVHEHEANHPVFEYGEVEELLQLTERSFEERLLTGWDTTARQVDPPAVRIIEGAFFQIPVGVMLSMNVPAARIRALLHRIESTISRLDVSLIYLHQPDLRAALLRVGEVRGVQWLEAMTAAVGQSAYGRAHRVRNLNGLIEYYRRQRAVIDSVFPRLTVRRLAIDVSGGRWNRYQRQMTRFLGIRQTPPVELRPADLLRHVGSYRGATEGKGCVITTDAHALYMHMPSTSVQRLVRVSDGHFCVQSLPIDVRFSYDRKRQARRFEYESRMANEILRDTTWSRA